MRKLKINPDDIHQARRKLLTRSELDPADRRTLLDLIQQSERIIYPGRMEWDRYRNYLQQFQCQHPESQPEVFNNLAEKIMDFEDKYC